MVNNEGVVYIMGKQELKEISVTELACMIKPGYTVDLGADLAIPYQVLKYLPTEGVFYRSQLALADVPKGYSTFFGKTDRAKRDKGEFTPIIFSLSKRAMEEHIADIAIVQVTEGDYPCYFNLGASVVTTLGTIDTAKIKVAIVNDAIPRTLGQSNVEKSKFDYVVYMPSEKLIEYKTTIPKGKTLLTRAIAKNVLPLIEEGCTLQLGIGAIPDMLCDAIIARGTTKNLNIFSEVISDGVMKLDKAGFLNPNNSVEFSVAFGTQALYEYISNDTHRKSGTRFVTVSSPFISPIMCIAQQYKMISINQALGVDLQGNISSESIGDKQISGTGGALEFALGAQYSNGGKSIFVLPSAYKDDKGKLHSNIVMNFKEGTAITIPRSITQYVVTEYGGVNLRGLSLKERAEALISIAHPDCREALRAQVDGII